MKDNLFSTCASQTSLDMNASLVAIGTKLLLLVVSPVAGSPLYSGANENAVPDEPPVFPVSSHLKAMSSSTQHVDIVGVRPSSSATLFGTGTLSITQSAAGNSNGMNGVSFDSSTQVASTPSWTSVPSHSRSIPPQVLPILAVLAITVFIIIVVVLAIRRFKSAPRETALGQMPVQTSNSPRIYRC